MLLDCVLCLRSLAPRSILFPCGEELVEAVLLGGITHNACQDMSSAAHV